MSALVFTSDSRLMLVAPHPDDEALACSVLLQRALRAGAAVRVLYATDGENNPWPQRVLECRWRLNAADRKRWGKLRRAEALTALRVLGLHESDVRFLGLPDQGLTELLITDSQPAVDHLAISISDWAPTHLLVPSTQDTHPDHNALAVMLQLTLPELRPFTPAVSVWAYSVHGRSTAFFDRARELQQSKAEMAIKEHTIRCHKTQLKLSRRRFLAYVTRPERFLKLEPNEPTVPDGPIRWISRDEQMLRLKLVLPKKLIGPQGTLFVLGNDVAQGFLCACVPVPARSSAVEVSDCRTGQHLHLARYRGDAFTGEFAIPVNIFSAAHQLFVKFERRSWFFDQAGWFETSPIVAENTLTPMTTTGSKRPGVLF